MTQLPCITLWRPWSDWIAQGLKTIETRTHTRFACLSGKKIGIIGGHRWDTSALDLARLYLPEHYICPHSIIGLSCTAYVSEFRLLNAGDSQASLINCADTFRYGLVLTDIQRLDPPYAVSGSQGIKYIEFGKLE